MKVLLICFLLVGIGFSFGLVVLFGWYLLGRLTRRAERAVWARIGKDGEGDDLRQVVEAKDDFIKPVKL